MSANTDAIAAAHDAFNRGDIEAVLQGFDPEMEWNVPETLPYGGQFHGPEEIGGFFQSLTQHFSEINVQVNELIDAGEYVTDIGTIRGTAKEGGADVEAEAVFIWTMRDGKPVAFREFSDTAAILEGLRTGAAA
jgi:ketosteroid isomerase-like protein